MIRNPEKVFENSDWYYAWPKIKLIIDNVYMDQIKERGDISFSFAKKLIYNKTIKNISVSIKK